MKHVGQMNPSTGSTGSSGGGAGWALRRRRGCRFANLDGTVAFSTTGVHVAAGVLRMAIKSADVGAETGSSFFSRTTSSFVASSRNFSPSNLAFWSAAHKESRSCSCISNVFKIDELRFRNDARSSL